MSNTKSILHGFADKGLEDHTLAHFGHVTRATKNPERNGVSSHIQVDLSDPDKIPERAQKYDLGLFQPTCNKWADTTSISGDEEEWPDMIDEAREIAKKTCDHWIIENKPKAWNEPDREQDPSVILEGHHFGLPVKYERGFECSFQIEQPERLRRFGNGPYETGPFFDSEKSRTWWAALKGVPVDSARKGYISRNCIPRAYLQFLLRSWQDAVDAEQGIERADYSNYDEEMDVRRAREANHDLEVFANAE